MNSFEVRSIQVVAALGLALGGCTADAAEPAEEEVDVAVDGVIDGTLLHAVRVADDHILAFYEYGEALYGVRESLNVDDADSAVLDAVADGSKLADIYRLAQPDRDVPAALLEADRVIARTRATEANAPEPTPAEHEVGVTAAALTLTLTPEAPSKPCSQDQLKDKWGAQWFLDNYCNEGNFRTCWTNRYLYDSGEVHTPWFKVKQMEGDFNNGGHTMGWHRWQRGGCFGTCLKESRMLWDYPILPRKVEINVIASGYQRHYAQAWGWSSCLHQHAAHSSQ